MKQNRAIKFVTACLMTAVLTFGAMCLGTLTGRNAFGTPLAASAATERPIKISVQSAAKHPPVGEPEWKWGFGTANVFFVCADCGKRYYVENIEGERKYDLINSHSEKDRYSLHSYYVAKITLGGKEYIGTHDVYEENKLLKPFEQSKINIYTKSDSATVVVNTAYSNPYITAGYYKPIKFGYCGYINGRWQMIAEGYKNRYTFENLKLNTVYTIAVIYKVEGVWIRDFSNAIQFKILPPESTYPIFNKDPVCVTTRENGILTRTDLYVNIRTYGKAHTQYQCGIFVQKAGKWKLIQKISSIGHHSMMLSNLGIFHPGSKFKIAVCGYIDGEWDMSNIEKRAYTVTVREVGPKGAKKMNEDFFNQYLYIF